MSSITLAFDNDPSTENAFFFQLCGDVARNHCVSYQHNYFQLFPPDLNNVNLLERMDADSICMIAAHGSATAIFNEHKDEIISTKTINYGLKGKTVYTVSCHAGNELGEALKRIGTTIFIGYTDFFKIGSDYDVFAGCALSGFGYLLSGKTLKESMDYMRHQYKEAIKSTSNTMDKLLLLDNLESLVAYGDSDTRIT